MADDVAAPGEEIPAALDGERLDRVISLLTGASRSVATSAVESGGVRVDGVVATSGKVRSQIAKARLEDINDIFDRLEHGKVEGRMVLDFA